jgi:hypothetical protein
LFVCGQWLSLERGHCIVEKDYDSGKIQVGVILENAEKPDGRVPSTIRTVSIRMSLSNIPDIMFGCHISSVMSVLLDLEDSDEVWNEIARTEPLAGRKELFWPAVEALQFDPPSSKLPHGIKSLIRVVFLANNEVLGNVQVTVQDILSHASARTGLCITSDTVFTGTGAADLDPRILRNLLPNLFFIGTRSTVVEPKTATFLNLRMMVSNLPPRVPISDIFACVFANDREILRTNHRNGDFEPFWDALPLQVDPFNPMAPQGLNTQVRVAIIEKSADFGEQIFGSVSFHLKEALKLASLRRGIPLAPDGVLDVNVITLLEPKMFFYGTFQSFEVFDPSIHRIMERPLLNFLPRPPSEALRPTSTAVRKLSRARIIRDFEVRQSDKDAAKSSAEDAKNIAHATAVIARFYAKIMYKARKKGGPNVKFLSFFKNKKSRAALLIQRLWRAHAARTMCSIQMEARTFQRLLEKRASMRIQCSYRCHIARQIVRDLTLTRRNFRIAMLVIKVQARFRGILGRYRAQRAKHEHHHRLKLQMYVRRWLLNKRIQNRRQNNAATLIQRNVLVTLGTNNALRYAISQRRYMWQGLFIMCWVVMLVLLSIMTMKYGMPLKPLNIRGMSLLVSESKKLAPLRSYVMFDILVSQILPALVELRRNSSIGVIGSPYWELRVGGDYNGIFLPATTMFVPVDTVFLRLRRLLHFSSAFVSDELLSVVGNNSKNIYTSFIDRSDMREPGLFCPWSESAGPIVGCPTCNLYLPPNGNTYAYDIQSDPIALDILQAQGWDFAGVTSVAVDIPFLSVLSPTISILTMYVQVPDHTGGSGLSHLTLNWQTRSVSLRSWFSPTPYPAAVALSVTIGSVAFFHFCDVFRDPKQWLFKRHLSM